MRYVILTCVFSIFLFSGCNGPEYDAQKMHKRQKTLMELQEEAVQDDSLSDVEIELIIQAHRENIGFMKSVLKKYKTDSVQMRTYKLSLYDMNQQIKAKQDSVNHQVRISKRYDELRKRLFELYFGKHKK